MQSSTLDLRATIPVKPIITDDDDKPVGLGVPSEVPLGEVARVLSEGMTVTAQNISDAGATGRAVVASPTTTAGRTALGVSVYDATTAQNAIKNKAAIAALTSSSTAADIVAALKA